MHATPSLLPTESPRDLNEALRLLRRSDPMPIFVYFGSRPSDAQLGEIPGIHAREVIRLMSDGLIRGTDHYGEDSDAYPPGYVVLTGLGARTAYYLHPTPDSPKRTALRVAVSPRNTLPKDQHP